MGDIGRIKVICSSGERKSYITCDGSREWISLIEYISINQRKLPPWFIFKGKLQLKVWQSVLKSDNISLSENGWTDNELGRE